MTTSMSRVLVMVVCMSTVLLAAANATAVQGAPPPIIDMHLHARDAVSPARKVCLPVTVYGVENPQCEHPFVSELTNEGLVAGTVAMLERHNIFGVISGYQLTTVQRYVAAAPHRLIPAYQFTAGHQDALSPKALREHILAGDYAVMGEVENQYFGVAPNDPRMDAYWALAAELDIPIAIHLGEGYPGAPYTNSPEFRVRLGSPLLLEEVLNKYPSLRIYVMHYGSPRVDEMIAIMYTYPNVYIDIGGSTWAYSPQFFHAQLKKFIDAGFGKRILFGSDQMRWPELITMSIEIVEQTPFLSEEQKRDIFYNNAAQFLRLSDKEIARHWGE